MTASISLPNSDSQTVASSKHKISTKVTAKLLSPLFPTFFFHLPNTKLCNYLFAAQDLMKQEKHKSSLKKIKAFLVSFRRIQTMNRGNKLRNKRKYSIIDKKAFQKDNICKITFYVNYLQALCYLGLNNYSNAIDHLSILISGIYTGGLKKEDQKTCLFPEGFIKIIIWASLKRAHCYLLDNDHAAARHALTMTIHDKDALQLDEKWMDMEIAYLTALIPETLKVHSDGNIFSNHKHHHVVKNMSTSKVSQLSKDQHNKLVCLLFDT